MLPIADYDYHLPPELIAQTPAEPRDHSRLLVLRRDSGELEHRRFYDVLRYLRPGDLLVVNDSRVLPARLHGSKESGGRIEILLLRQRDELRWEALVRGKVAVGTALEFRPQESGIGNRESGIGGDDDEVLLATVDELLASGSRVLRFDRPINDLLPAYGVMPTPPYITAPLDNPERYQTVYSARLGSAAAPTAGLHWTPELIERARSMGVSWASVTLHVGLDTFRPVQTDNALEHEMHSEWFELPAATAAAINATRAAGGRVIAVGTTSVRVLETAGMHQESGVGIQDSGADSRPPVTAQSGWTNIFIYPPHRFRVVDGLITNFHLPRSTLLLLVSALAGRDKIFRAYAEAIAERYRFFSFGDAMLII
jgi:S-adenosylmethionine:tRNA ribosyltransferase-isomerase